MCFYCISNSFYVLLHFIVNFTYSIYFRNILKKKNYSFDILWGRSSLSQEMKSSYFVFIQIPPLQARCEARSILKRSKASLNFESSFSKNGCLTKANELNLPGGRGEQKDPCLSQWDLFEGKRKKLRPGFELVSPIPFHTTETVTLSLPPY